MRMLAVGSLVISCIVFVACQQPAGYGPNPGAPGQPPPYGQPQAPAPGYGQAPAPGYGQPPAPGYPQAQAPGQPPTYGQPPAYGQAPAPGYPAQPAPGYPAQPAPAPVPPAPGPGPAASAGAMAVPGAAAFPCSNDAACGLAHCNTQYGKCAFPCADANVDCIQGAMCVAGFCVPKIPGT